MHIWLRRAAIAAAAVSMGFTAYFGWVTGGEDTFAKWFNAAGGALISFAVPAFFFLAAIAVQRKAYGIAKTFFAFGCVFGFMDAASNTGALFSMREGSKINARHATTVSTDLRERVKRLKARNVTLNRRIEFSAHLKAVKAYDGPIRTATLARDLEAGRGGCKTECEKKDKALGLLEADRANAVKRDEAKAELKANMAELAKAEETSAGTPAKVSPIDVITAKIGAIAAWDLKPGESVKEFVYLLITAVLGTGLTLLSGGLGYGATWLRGYDDSESYQPEYQPVDRQIAAAPEFKPQPLKAEPIPTRTSTSSVTVNYAGQNRPSVDRLMQMIADFEAKAT